MSRTAHSIAIETIPAMTILVRPVIGPYLQHPAVIEELMRYADSRGLIQGTPFAIYHSSPEQVPEESAQWDVCVKVPSGTTAADPFEVRKVPNTLAAVLDYTGPYEDTGASYGELAKWITENGYALAGSPQEHWLSDPQTTPPEERRARIVFPIVQR